MLSPVVRKKLEQYFSQQPEIAAAFLFGSAARGESHQFSDLDVGILFHHGREDAGIRLSKLTADLMNIFGRGDVDAVILNGASPVLQHRVIRDGHVLYAPDGGAVADFVVRGFQRYEDTRPLRRLQASQLRRRVRRAASKPEGGGRR